MGLDDILSAIHSDTNAEIADVLAWAHDEVSSIEARARIDGEAAAAILEAAEVAKVAQEEGKTIREVVVERGILSSEEVDKLFAPQNLCDLLEDGDAPADPA